MEKRTILNSPRIVELKKKRKKVLYRKILLYFLLAILLFVSFVFLSRWRELNIKIAETQIIGNKVVDSGEIQAVIAHELQGYYLFFIPKTNFLFFPKKSITQSLSNKFKRLETVNISLTQDNILKVILTEHKAVYMWCGESISISILQTNDSCYFINDLGYIFDQAPFFSGDVYLRFFGKIKYSNTIENTIPIGSYFLPESFKDVSSFVEFIKSLGLELSSLEVLDNENANIYLAPRDASKNSPKVIFKINSDFEKIKQNLQTVINTEPFKSDFKNKYSSLEYIDLRFGNKVYYKFK